MRDRSGRIRLYPYRVVWIDAIFTPAQVKGPLPVYTDIIRAPNSEQAKKVIVAEHPCRTLMFLTADRYPDNKVRPDLAEFRKLTAYEVKVVEAQITTLATAHPIGNVVKVPTAADPTLTVKLNNRDMLSVGGFTVGVMSGKQMKYTSTATTFPAVAPAQPLVWTPEDTVDINPDEVSTKTLTSAANDVFDDMEGITPICCEPDPVETFIPREPYTVDLKSAFFKYDKPDPVETFHPKPDIAGIDAVLERERASYQKPTPIPPAAPKLNRFFRTLAFVSGMVHGYIKKPR